MSLGKGLVKSRFDDESEKGLKLMIQVHATCSINPITATCSFSPSWFKIPEAGI
jgi:hypothetical protein